MERKELVLRHGRGLRVSVTKEVMNVEWTFTVLEIRNVASVAASRCV